MSSEQHSAQDGVSSEPFVYPPLSISKNEFRLLQLLKVDDSEEVHASLATCALDAAPRYHALSYCWGKGHAKNSILLNGIACPVTENLYNALLALKFHQINTVWIDALCINQLDDDEKSIQVLRMATIFRQAFQVAIWLGPYNAPLLRVVKKLSKEGDAAKIDEREFSTITMSPYWRRVWIQQEVAVADELVIIGPSSMLGWEAFLYALRDNLKSRAKLMGYGSLALHSVISMRSKYWSAPTLLQALVQTAHSEATDPRDKIYALLALASDGPRVISLPSYGSQLAQINIQVTLNVFRSEKCLDCICLRRLQQKRGADSQHPEPSWCPDWSDLGGIGLGGRMLQYIGSGGNNWGWKAVPKNLKTLPWNRKGNQLMVRGISLGSIWSLSSAQKGTTGPVKNTIRNPWRLKQMEDNGKIANVLVGCFTQTYGKIERHEIDMYIYSAYTSAILRGGKKNTGLSSWLSDNKDLVILGKTMEQILLVKLPAFVRPNHHASAIAGDNTRLDRLMKQISRHDASQKEHLAAATQALSDDIEDLLRQQSRLMSTHKGYVGWVHPLADLDDEIYLIEGCTIPIVLRPTPEKHHYIVIGDARINSVMCGEGVVRAQAPGTSF